MFLFLFFLICKHPLKQCCLILVWIKFQSYLNTVLISFNVFFVNDICMYELAFIFFFFFFKNISQEKCSRITLKILFYKQCMHVF